MRASSLFALVVAVLSGAAGSSASPARRAATSGAPTFVITGHGWGHGVGMGQYGALGYARHGMSYAKILAHYYPGTTLSSTIVGEVRVLLADGISKLTISSRAAFRVRGTDGKSYKLQAGSYTIGPKLEIRVSASAAPTALPGPVIFTPGQLPLQLGRRYRGSIEVISKGGSLQAVNIVGLEDYVSGVVPDEVSSDEPAAALEAQAVASRSYAVSTRKKGSAFDVYPDTRSQVYGGVDDEEFSTSAAVDATAGKILTFHGQPAIAYFSASSGGRTAAIEDAFPGSKPVPYLVSVPDPYDTLSPYHSWGPYVYSGSLLASRLGVSGKLIDARVTRNPSRRVTSVTALTSVGQKTLTGPSVRNALGLRSTWFTIGVLALDTPDKPLVYGVESDLTGTARAVANVQLEQLSGGAWQQVAPVEAGADGTFAVTVTPKATASYRLSSGKATAGPVNVLVAPFVRLDPATSQAALTGRVRPVYPGIPVAIQRSSGSVWTKVAAATLDGQGRFEAKLNLIPGTYRARVAPGHGLVPGFSPVLRVVGA